MSNEHNLTDNIIYNMVSVQYHALKSANVYDRYLEDCHGHEDVSAFILQCQTEDAARVQRAHDLIRSLMQGANPGDAGQGAAEAQGAAEPEEAAQGEPAQGEAELVGVGSESAQPVAAASGGRRKRMPSGEKVTRWR